MSESQKPTFTGVTRAMVFLALAAITGLWIYVMTKNEHVNAKPAPVSTDSTVLLNQLVSKATGASRGSSNPRVLLIEFTDLQCPSCKGFQPTVERLLKDNSDARLIFQNFPLPIHDWAFKAASYAECVHDEDTFWRFTTAVYDHQDSITATNVDEQLTALAGALGLDGRSTAVCVVQQETAARVNKSIELGKEIGVTGTPTLFINGHKVTGPGGLPYERLNAMVRFAANVHGGLESFTCSDTTRTSNSACTK
jgi:protein-disulfide isomerase